MRTLKNNQGITPIQVNSDFPDGAIIDETNIIDGTAVVREIYNDPLVNIYKLMRLVGVTPNGVEDSETNGYQFLAALQKLCNVQNDIEQALTLISTTFSINMAIDLLPNKYVIFAKASADYVAGPAYTFKGTSSLSYPFTSPTRFNNGDELLLIINQAGVVAYSLSGISPAVASEVTFPAFGSPLAYNDSAKLWYQSEGILYSDAPDSYDLQSAIRTASGDGTMLVYEMLCIGTRIVCLVFSNATSLYRLYGFTTSNLSTTPVTIGATFGTSPDRQPFIFYDGTHLYITNASGTSATDGSIDIYTINLTANTLTNTGSISLTSFQKSTNTVIVASYLYTFISGVITQYNLSTGARVVGPSFPGNIGLIFLYQGIVYYASSGVAKKWNLPVYS